MYAPNISRNELIHSNYAAKHGIDNTPSQLHEGNLQRLSWFLQAVRQGLCDQLQAKVKIFISSGYRCEELNQELDGSPTSFHMQGRAADITCSHLTPMELAEWISENMKGIGYEECINEFDRWVHIAIPPDAAINEDLTAMRTSAGTKYLPGIFPSTK